MRFEWGERYDFKCGEKERAFFRLPEFNEIERGCRLYTNIPLNKNTSGCLEIDDGSAYIQETFPFVSSTTGRVEAEIPIRELSRWEHLKEIPKLSVVVTSVYELEEDD